jgi:hypothetical protein
VRPSKAGEQRDRGADAGQRNARGDSNARTHAAEPLVFCLGTSLVPRSWRSLWKAPPVRPTRSDEPSAARGRRVRPATAGIPMDAILASRVARQLPPCIGRTNARLETISIGSADFPVPVPARGARGRFWLVVQTRTGCRGSRRSEPAGGPVSGCIRVSTVPKRLRCPSACSAVTSRGTLRGAVARDKSNSCSFQFAIA